MPPSRQLTPDRSDAFRNYLLTMRARCLADIARIDDELSVFGLTPLPRKTPAACVAILQAIGAPASPQCVARRMREQGRDVLDAAVYQALHRLWRAGTIVRQEAGRYMVKGGSPESEET